MRRLSTGKSRGKNSIWNLPFLRSRIKAENVTIPEMIFGYFLGPLGVLVMTTVVSTYYLTYYRTYEDVVSQGTFLAMLPLVSVVPMILANIFVGILIGKTDTAQGKARPYILLAAPLLLVAGILVFGIPNVSLGGRMIWMAVTYNLFAAIANPMYSSSHFLMVSLSTRDLKQRGTLSVVSNIPAVAANGLVSSILMPLILSWIKNAGTVAKVQGRWSQIMTVFSVIAFFACMLEYLFTRERITEEGHTDKRNSAEMPGVRIEPDQCQAYAEKQQKESALNKISSVQQLKAAASDRYWWIIMIFYALYQAGVMFKGGFIFNIFCNEFFQEVTVFGVTMNSEMVQSVLALISGILLAAGMLFIWPLASRFGKKNMIAAGLVLSVAGSLVCLCGPGNFWIMLVGQTLKGTSSIPGAYIMMALFADVLDHLEARFGFRCDGVSMSVYSSVVTAVNGLAVAVFLFFYDNPALPSDRVAEFFFVGFEVIAHTALIFVLHFLDVEKNIVKEQELIKARKAAE